MSHRRRSCIIASGRDAEDRVGGEPSGDVGEGLIDAVSKEQIVIVLPGYNSVAHNSLPVDHSAPIGGPEEHHGEVSLHLAGLLESQDLEEFIHGAHPPRCHHQGLAVIDHPEFASEEVMIFEG